MLSRNRLLPPIFWIIRVLLAVLMIPVGVALGLGGLIQNRCRRKQYLDRQEQIRRQAADGPAGKGP